MDTTLEETLSAKVRALTPAQQQKVLDFILLEQADVPPAKTPPGVPGASWAQFAGSISREDLALMEQTIEEGCEKVDADGW